MSDQVPIDRQVVEDAIFDWFTGRTGLTTIWTDQKKTQPPYPYATLKIIAGPIKEGGADETRATTDLTQPAGQEVQLHVTGPRVFTLSCQAFVGDPAGSTPAADALHFMSLAQSSLGLQSVLDALDAAGVAVVSEGEVTDLSEFINDDAISRASLDPRFRVSSDLSERTGYIDKTEVSSTFSGGVSPSDLDDTLIDGS